MNYREISNLVEFNEKYESKNFIVNEVFEDLKSNISSASHIAFSYSYLYLVQWLYRQAKYFNVKETIDNSKLKEILGYDKNNRTVNYLIKKDGLLDKINYLETTRDYPVSWTFTKDEPLEFLMSSDLDFEEGKEYLPTMPKRFYLKKPLKGFDDRTVVIKGEETEASGVFYQIDCTHNIPFEVFMYCMSKEDLGCVAFYLYSYLKHRNDIHVSGVDVSLDNLAKETGISRRTVNKYIGLLKSYKMIDFKHNQEFFVIGMAEGDRMSNTYITRDYDFFSEEHVPYHRIEVKSNEFYVDYLKGREEMTDYIENQMPF